MLEKHASISASCGREILPIQKPPQPLRLDNSTPWPSGWKETAGYGELSLLKTFP